jgi:heterodisulfide reductase subunit A
VVTSLEFERILSATGPYQGHVVRPSDKKDPQKIAWLQCVGSRDTHSGAASYCSSVCCTYAIKEAIVALEHVKDGLDTAIFYIDMRTHGKDFERYYNRAQESGVRFVKSRISGIQPVGDSGDLMLRYTDGDGRRVEEVFDMVVLSVGFRTSPEALQLAERLGIDVDQHQLAVTNSFKPVETSKAGVFVCGSFQAPKDIPQSVIESSACAAVAQSTLADARFANTQEPETPEEIDVAGDAPRVGVFVCHCGTNIAGVIDVEEVAKYAETLPNVAYVERNLFSCSQDTQEKMTQIIKEQNLNRVVVSACSPRTHEELFQETVLKAGINKYLFEMANIRNQCSWVHSGDSPAATKKAKDLVRMAVRKVSLLEPLKDPVIDINSSALVIGGGLSGMAAAVNMADQGYQTYLLEKSGQLGGQARHLHETWQSESIGAQLDSMISKIEKHPKIEVHLNAEINSVEGFVGNFQSTISADGKEQTLDFGVAIVATGAGEYKPEDMYLYGNDPRVQTSLELDGRFKAEDPSLTKLSSAVFIQCVGSRIPERPYCSKVCCTHSVKSALQLKKINPEMDVVIIYRDMRTYGLREDLYREARAQGVIFVRYDAEKDLSVALDQGDLKLQFTNYVLKRTVEVRPDLLVLATAIVPPQDNPVAQLFKLPVNDDGFFVEAHAKLRPIDFATDGVFVSGLAHSPKPVDEAIAQGLGAASRAASILSKETMSGNAIVSRIDPHVCRGCQQCVNVCPYQAISYMEETALCEVNAALCKGCGACAVACPTGAASNCNFTDNEMLTMVEAAFLE